MAGKIKIGIVGYGNLGRGVESAIAQNGDMELTAVFTRRDPGSVDLLDSSVPVRPLDSVAQFTDDIEVVILCGGPKNDMPGQGLELAALFNTVASFDTQAKLHEYLVAVAWDARHGGNTALLTVGGDTLGGRRVGKKGRS